MKYLHIEIINDQLYVYIDNNKRSGVVTTKEQLDNECMVEDEHIVLKIKDLYDASH